MVKGYDVLTPWGKGEKEKGKRGCVLHSFG